MRPVQWVVLTPQNPPKGDYTYFALDPQGYENLAMNMGELERFIKEAMFRLEYYRGEVADVPVLP